MIQHALNNQISIILIICYISPIATILSYIIILKKNSIFLNTKCILVIKENWLKNNFVLLNYILNLKDLLRAQHKYAQCIQWKKGILLYLLNNIICQ